MAIAKSRRNHSRNRYSSARRVGMFSRSPLKPRRFLYPYAEFVLFHLQYKLPRNPNVHSLLPDRRGKYYGSFAKDIFGSQAKVRNAGPDRYYILPYRPTAQEIRSHPLGKSSGVSIKFLIWSNPENAILVIGLPAVTIPGSMPPSMG